MDAAETYSFLFTDVEGSIRLWEERGAEMSGALHQHDTLLRQVIGAHGGKVFKTVGDAFFAVFPRADLAVNAALEAQRSLIRIREEGWKPEENGLPLRVRMAVHCGPAEARSDDYFGPSVNRVARLLAAGHGGQVLISQAVCERAINLPEGTSLRALGTRRLRDLQHPEPLYQLVHPDLPDDFPPLRSLEAFAHNLPVQISSFVGREGDILQVRRLLAAARLLTLTGPGGVGKTRLALQAAADLLDDFPAGVWFVDLSTVADPALAPRAVLTALGVREEAGRDAVQTLSQTLSARAILLILDNCEHLAGACAAFAEALLRACPGARILATSREALNVAGETVWRVPLLSLPHPNDAPDRIHDSEAVRLFLERARSARPGFALTPENTPAVVEICRRLDGIPLALELAAARLRGLSPEQIAALLDDSLRLLTAPPGRRPPHQRTLQATIEWSVDLLEPNERLLLNRLSVFASGWTLDAAETVCAGGPLEPFDVLDALLSLADRSLVLVGEADGEARYRLLEVVRQFAAAHLTADETEELASRHARYYLALAEELEPKLTGAEQARWLDRLEAEAGNLRAALRRFRCEPETTGTEAGQRLAGALWWFWYVRGFFVEGSEALQAALDRKGKAAPVHRAKALHAAGSLARNQGHYDRARALFEQALVIRREIDDRRGQASTLYSLGLAAQNYHDLRAAQGYMNDALRLNRELGNREWEGAVLNSLGAIARWQGDYAQARALAEESRALYLAFGDRLGVANALNALGMNAYFEGNHAAAARLFNEVLTELRALRDRRGVASTLENVGNVALAQQDWAAAVEPFEESAALCRELGNRVWEALCHCRLGWARLETGMAEDAELLLRRALNVSVEMRRCDGAAYALEGLARVWRAQGCVVRAVELFGAAVSLFEISSALRPPPEVLQTEAFRRLLSAELAVEEFADAMARGGCVPLERLPAFVSSAPEGSKS